eukprot:m.87690 g.87690  ORF g.87690 m.87690 type:complete len:216 (+) comp14514_c0_seq1:243-890(+)
MSKGSVIQKSLLLAHENGYLSWSRNAIIATAAGTAFYNIDPLASAGLFGMGSLFMYSGTLQYWIHAVRLHKEARFRPYQLGMMIAVPTTIVTLWTISVISLLGQAPSYLKNSKLPEIFKPRQTEQTSGQQQQPPPIDRTTTEGFRLLSADLQLQRAAAEKHLIELLEAEERRDFLSRWFLRRTKSFDISALEQRIEMIDSLLAALRTARGCECDR